MGLGTRLPCVNHGTNYQLERRSARCLRDACAPTHQNLYGMFCLDLDFKIRPEQLWVHRACAVNGDVLVGVIYKHRRV